MRPPPGERIPGKFWQSLSDEEWEAIWQNDGDLNAELCAKLWRMTDRQGSPPLRMTVLVSKKDLMRLFPMQRKKR